MKSTFSQYRKMKCRTQLLNSSTLHCSFVLYEGFLLKFSGCQSQLCRARSQPQSTKYSFNLGNLHFSLGNLPAFTKLKKTFLHLPFYHGPNVSRAMVMWRPCWRVTDWLIIIEQTRTNMSQPGRRLGTHVGNECHVLQALWSRKDV